MRNALSLISKIKEKGNRFIIEKLNENGAKDLMSSHGDILHVLYKYGNSTMKDIADKINKTKPTVTVLIDKLEKQGYVRREKISDDTRITHIVLTEKGLAFKPIFENISKDLNKILYKNLTEEESDTLDELLKKML